MPADQAELAAALKQAKSKPMHFTFVAKGTQGKLLVDRVKIPAKEAADAKKTCGGGTIFKGRCFYEGDSAAMIFEVPVEPPGTLAALIKKIIKADAGQAMNVEVRFNAALEEVAGDGTDGDLPPAPPVPPPPPPSMPTADSPAAQVMKRLNALSGAIKAALAGPNKANVQALFVAVNGSIKNQDFAQAEQQLDQLETLVAPTLAPTPPPSGGADVVKRLNSMSADIKTALAGPNRAEVQTLFVAVNTAVRDKDFAQAARVLDELARRISASGASSQKKPSGPVAYAKLLLDWRAAQERVTANIGAIGRAILARPDVQEDPRFPQVKAAVAAMPSLVPEFGAELGDLIDAAMNAGAGPEASALLEKARGVTAIYRTKLDAAAALAGLEKYAAEHAVGEPNVFSALDAALAALEREFAARAA